MGGQSEQSSFPNGKHASTLGALQQLDLRGTMRKRGKVLRDPFAGPGLLMVEGRQYPFSLESLWKSEGPPKPGLPVDIEFGQSGQIIAISVVPESDLAREKAAAAQQKNGSRFLNRIAARFGMSR